MCLGVCSSSYPCVSRCSQTQRGWQINVLTNDRLAFLGALGSKASRIYAEWHERPTKRFAGHFKASVSKGIITAMLIVAHIMEVHSVLHQKNNSHSQKSSPMQCGVMTPEKKKETELTGMDGRPQAFRKVCRAYGRTRFRICDLL